MAQPSVFISYSPKSMKAVLVRLKELINLDMNFEEIDNGIKELEGKLDFIRQQNPEFNTYIEKLEKDFIEMPHKESLNISADDAVRLAEEFLKDNED